MSTMKTPPLSGGRVAAAVVMLSVLVSSDLVYASGEEHPAELAVDKLLPTLMETDSSFMEALTASIVVTEPSHVMFLDQGAVTRTGAIACLGSSAGLILEEPRFERTPIYENRGRGQYAAVDYDENDNLIVWRPGELFFFRNRDVNRTYEVKSVQRIGPNNAVGRTDQSYRLSEHLVSDDRGSILFSRIIMAMGRGFAQHLNTIKTARSQPLGLIEVVADGSYGPRLPGTWTITVDPAAGHLVRSASFVKSGWEGPSLLVSTTGTQAGVFPLQGQVTHRLSEGRVVLTTTVEFSDPKNHGQESVVGRARATVLGELPVETEVFDYRGGQLKRYPIGEEPPDSE